MVLKIAIRNFTKNLKTSFIVVLGLAISLSLVIGSLTLSDSINAWKQERIEENFGVADAVAEPKSPSFLFFDFLTTKIKNEEIELLRKQVERVLPVSEGSARLDGLDVLVIGVKPDELGQFVGKDIQLNPGEVIVGKSLADALNLRIGERITLIFSTGNKDFIVKEIGENGFLNFKGEMASLPGTVFIHLKDFPDSNYPTKCYLHYGLPLDEHEKISIETSLRVRKIKHNFLKSPVNRSLTYVTLAFSGMSIFVGFLVFYMFCEDVMRDRNFTLVTLRKIGIQKKKEWGILLLEGLLYSSMAAFFGLIFGTFVGKYLLNQFQVVVDAMSTTFLHIDRVVFHISPKTVLIGLGLGVAFPMVLFALKSRDITRKPPIYHDLEDRLDVSTKRFVLMIMVSLMLIPFSGLRIFSVILLPLALSLKFKNAFLLMMMGVMDLVIGVLINVNPQSERLFLLSSMSKGASIFTGISLLVFSLVLLTKNVLDRMVSEGNLPLLIGLSYVQRFPRKGMMISLTFALLIFTSTVFNILSASADRFVKEKVKNGLFGYNFLVLENPFRSFLSKSSIPAHEKLELPSRAYLYILRIGETDRLIAYVDYSFLEHSTLKVTNIEDLKVSNAALVGYETAPETIRGTLKSIFPFGGRENASFKVVGRYNKNDYLVPVDMIALEEKKPENVKGFEVLLGKADEKSASEIKRFYLSRFLYPFFLNEELGKLYSGIEGLVNVIKFIFLFGFLSATTGLVLFVLKSYFSRVKILGTLRAVGLKSTQLIFAFLVEHFSFLGGGIIIGTVSGIVMGLSITKTMAENLGTFVAFLPIKSIILSILFVVVLAAIAMVVPSYMISRVSPLEAMKEGE
ncbi:ABC transporter permease [Thermotoga sp. SG1]|uniref:ABC transporter permease n=1 Tax=Thermotoga sp. SG1 TaxID=126739 RepID=UPI000CC0DFD5|nr:ABC transporter permease [Thermotoga sp. SG1]PLV56823.1 multidrug ABC transporter substrate-binding protein [Thermotoga sp. SG1]